MADKTDLQRYGANLQSEVDASYLYHFLAEEEPSQQLRELYGRLADVEQRHADFWAERMAEAGSPPGATRPSSRAKILAWFGRRFDPHVVVGVMADQERVGQYDYDGQPEAADTDLPADERSHARILASLVSVGGGVPGRSLARLEGRHRLTGPNALRAAVLGANDGLVSNLSLVMGVAGAGLAASTVLITGIAGLLAGAISMGLGEWISVKSGRELVEQELEVERLEIEEYPDEEAEELRLIYMAKGLPEDQARELAEHMMAEPGRALDTMAREELGIDPEELGGSPWTAAWASFLLFSLGAIFPVIPFMFLEGPAAIGLAVALSALALFGLGAAITLMTGRSVWTSGLRQTAFGVVAAAVTFGIGRLIGMNLA